MQSEIKNINKKLKIINNSIKFFNLNLKDLIVFTELGSNDYMYTPIIATLARARKVYAYVKNSSYGTKDDLMHQLKKINKFFKFSKKINIVTDFQKLKISDIVLNSGFIRPINKKKIDLMKNTAVIPLMWETWEFRSKEIDISYAKRKKKLILGTKEDFLYNNSGFLVTKLLFESGLGVYKDNILVLSSGRLGDSICKFFENTQIRHKRISFDKKNRKNKNLVSPEYAIKDIKNFDAIIVAEHQFDYNLLSNEGLFQIKKIKSENPNIKIIHICGKINQKEIMKSKLEIYPKKIAPFGYMSVTAAYLDSHAVLELNTAGLKVGEIMSRHRLKHDIKSAYKKSLKDPLVDDFKGGYFNFIPKN